MQKTPIYGLDTRDINKLLVNESGISDNATLLMNLIYRQYKKDIEKFTQFSSKFKNYLFNNYSFDLPQINKTQVASDGTIKFLLKLSDGLFIETVALNFRNKLTLCVSSQVGCAMNCSFCHTATQGLKRNLKSYEIVMQFVVAQRYLKDIDKNSYPITNIVFMGQGEPLHNFENVKKAINVLTDRHGISLSKKNITISTSGYLPGLKRFNELGVNIALSLHSTDKEIRSELIPINKSYPISKIMQQLDELKLGPRQTIVYEYLLIKDLNNKDQDIDGLYDLLGKRKAYINIIPFNEFPGSKYKRPSDTEIEVFKQKLINKNLNVLVRKTKGDDILAACGQLKS